MATINNSINNTLQPNFYVGATQVTTTGTQLNYLNTTTGVSGTGNLVLNNGPTLIAPLLGTPASGNLANCTALPIGGINATGTPSATTYLRGDATWATISGSGTVNSGLINQLAWYAAGGTAVSGLATANNGVLVTNAGGVPSISTTLPSGLTATNLNLITPALGTPSGGILSNTTGGGGLRSVQVFTSGTSATYTKPANVTSILVEVVGGGGGGGGQAGATSSAQGAGGGGSGGYAALWVPSASATYTYTVGAGGAGGTAGANTGTTGGTTTFSASSLQATGGVGGIGAASVINTATSFNLGGSAGQGTNGTVNTFGSPGSFGGTVIGNTIAGQGGSAIYGGGAKGAAAANAGNYGSGGSGATGTTVSTAGGNGSGGIIIVWEYS